MLLDRHYIALFLITLLDRMSMGSESAELTTENMCYWTNASYDEDCELDPGKQQIKEIRFTNGMSSGVVIAEVQMPPISCNYVWFHVILKAEKGNSDVDNYCDNEHSWRIYKRVKCGSESCKNICGKFTKFTFYQVNKGRYFLLVRAYNDMNGFNNYQSKIMEITTDYNGSLGTPIDMKLRPSIERDTVNFGLVFTPPVTEVLIEFIDAIREKIAHISLETYKFEQTMKPYIEEKKCNITMEKSKTRQHGKIIDLSCHMNVPDRARKLQITFPKENACDNEARFLYDSEVLCVCWTTTQESLQIEERSEAYRESNHSLLYISVPAAFLLLITLIAIIIIYGCRRSLLKHPSHYHGGQSISNLISVGDIEILLLYPRDCPQFMKSMKSLKLFLETTYQIQVYDCYDECTKGALGSPAEWFQSLLIHERLRFIIVTTECACLLQEAHLNNTMCMYRQPEYLDNFYIYALSHIKREFSLDVYHRIFVVRISGFSDDVDLKFIPTALTCYELPNHFGKLLRDMNLLHSDEVFIEIDSKTNDRVYNDFMNSLEDLKVFRIENHNYLHQMLMLENRSTT